MLQTQHPTQQRQHQLLFVQEIISRHRHMRRPRKDGCNEHPKSDMSKQCQHSNPQQQKQKPPPWQTHGVIERIRQRHEEAVDSAHTDETLDDRVHEAAVACGRGGHRTIEQPFMHGRMRMRNGKDAPKVRKPRDIVSDIIVPRNGRGMAGGRPNRGRSSTLRERTRAIVV